MHLHNSLRRCKDRIVSLSSLVAFVKSSLYILSTKVKYYRRYIYKELLLEVEVCNTDYVNLDPLEHVTNISDACADYSPDFSLEMLSKFY